ncbi:Gpi16 subunit, GPI transamidase component [Polychaeton citri CBS 116435]|uniref:Gpi16 subunit, GPI transamidase component n=1 Tax=Polychaeton citri CBS 116435 TaxID=1314669 RepID=A0A9P4UMI6_9PEZI|nr:Gpi16 subunit, GPI transamidase component [Polychaeton citri CBS 116435]
MKLSQLLMLPAALASLTLAQSLNNRHNYDEHLHLQPLPSSVLYAGFNFTATTPLESYESQHFRYFPRFLGQILQSSHAKELHLRFSLGRWEDEVWGSRPRGGGKEGGTGVELWAWVEGVNQEEAMERWKDLVNGLSGLFCASLNFIDSTNTIRPMLTFEQQGQHLQSDDGLWLLHGALPHEVVCTENLTPFLKLLPCKGKAGVSSLLDGHKLFDASWQAMSIDIRPVCSDKEHCSLEIQQTVDMVLNIARSMRPRHDPIPRPAPIESIECDSEKHYNAPDTCYPLVREEPPTWSLSKIFGRPVHGSCPLGEAHEQRHDISIIVPVEQQVELKQGSEAGHGTNQTGRIDKIHLNHEEDFDLEVPFTSTSILQANPYVQFDDPPVYASRQMTGYGQERGGMHTTITNPGSRTHRVIFLESLPWFMRPFMHTLTVDGGKIEKMYYTPALDRERGTQLELLLEVPAHSTLVLTYDFEKAILRYTEYPPDANRGFDVAPAIIRVLRTSDDTGEQDYYLRTTSLLLPLPTPDFSMPYNVIILSSTVIALGFGSMFNLLVRRFVLIEEVPPVPLMLAIKKAVGRVKDKTKALKGGRAIEHQTGQEIDAKSRTQHSTSENGAPNGLVRRNVNPNSDEGSKSAR